MQKAVTPEIVLLMLKFCFISVPYGNYSYIKVLAEEKDLPLYGSGGFRLIWDTKFDAGEKLTTQYYSPDGLTQQLLYLY